VFFYSRSIFTNAKIQEDYIPFAVMGVNAVNVAMTVIAVRSLRSTQSAQTDSIVAYVTVTREITLF